ncbi:hypothetical protein SMD11_1260 [Streptomyces albireticuli]|uniref:C1q domain-containing protein n=1 Tax=Streptomyces albireticuli TaxID=1940 RepID=A0A1Z2KYA5_9ACTN|nr:hypothetical protein [Streptomyces albireticuli]ARZ66921.1 hypothetical protein SMD11_1260 [Streptomyces albireticuli]
MIHVVSMKTWADGEVVTPADMKTYVSDVLRGLLEPPACRRTAASQGSEQRPPDTWQVVRWDRPASGAGSPHSYDSTRGSMAREATKIHAPIPGLYEITCGIVVRSVSGALPYTVCAVNRNQEGGDAISSLAPLRFGCGRATSREKVGAGSATIPLDAGDFVSMAVNGSNAFYLGDAQDSQLISHMELRWVGVKP